MYKKILYPTDLSLSNQKSTSEIAKLAQNFGASVEVLHVLGKDVPPPPEDVREAELLPFLEEFRKIGVKVEPKHRYGKPYEEIIQEIQEKAFDLVVMPYLPRETRMGEQPPDPTAIRVAKLASCNVFLIKS